MEIDRSKRRHESPFADDTPENDSSFPAISPPQPMRPKRPDGAFFSGMWAAVFLIAAVCSGVWSFGVFQKYLRASNYAEYLRQNPNVISGGNYTQDELVRLNEIFASHDRFEALWTSAISLVCLFIGVYLVIRTAKTYQRLKNLDYEEIEWRSLEKPIGRIEVLYGQTHTVAAIIFYVFFGGLTLLAVLTSIKPDGIRLPGIVIGVFNFTLIGVIYYLLNNGKKRSIKSFDASGITRGDGRHFLWSDFRGVVTRIGTLHYGGKTTWRTELIFANGGIIWIIPQRIKNYTEVYSLVDALPRAVLKDT